MAYLLMRGVDQAKYGSLMKNLCKQFSLGNDQYPKTLVTATDVLSNHRLDQKYYDNKKKIADKRKTIESEENEKLETHFQQKTIKCYCCGEDGHAVPKCPMKDKIPKEDWYVQRAMSNMQEEDDSTNASNGSNKDKKQEDKDEKPERKTVRIKKGWGQFLQLKQDAEPQFKQMKNQESYLDDEIILDTGSTIKATFKIKNLLTNIGRSTVPILMNTNTRSKLIEEKG